MPFSVTPLAIIEREAKAAAERGETPNEACRYPFDDPAGHVFVRIYNEQRDALRARAAQHTMESDV